MRGIQRFSHIAHVTFVSYNPDFYTDTIFKPDAGIFGIGLVLFFLFALYQSFDYILRSLICLRSR